jgi:hypothetical protein
MYESGQKVRSITYEKLMMTFIMVLASMFLSAMNLLWREARNNNPKILFLMRLGLMNLPQYAFGGIFYMVLKLQMGISSICFPYEHLTEEQQLVHVTKTIFSVAQAIVIGLIGFMFVKFLVHKMIDTIMGKVFKVDLDEMQFSFGVINTLIASFYLKS